MSIEIMDYQVIALIGAVFILTVYAYSVGLKEGKRIGYHRGRSISFATYKENHKWYAALIPASIAIIARLNGAS